MAITFAVHRVEHTHVVDDGTNVRKQFADPCSTLAILLEGIPWFDKEPVELPGFIQPYAKL